MVDSDRENHALRALICELWQLSGGFLRPISFGPSDGAGDPFGADRTLRMAASIAKEAGRMASYPRCRWSKLEGNP
jgi:hypothetical protein